MCRGGLIAAVGLLILAGGPAWAASQKDWDNCSGKDLGADYSEAIRLVPRNIVAYAGRAVAYYHKGDRDRAVLDYTTAKNVDAKVFGEIANGNTELAAIAAIVPAPPAAAARTSTAAAPAAAAGPFCPTRETAGNGFALVNRGTGTRQEVKPSKGDMITTDLLSAGTVTATMTYYKGKYLVVMTSPTATTMFTYDFDYSKEADELPVGNENVYHLTFRQSDGKSANATIYRHVIGREAINIGDCFYDTLVIEVKTTYSDHTTFTRANFSPALRIAVRSIVTRDGSPTSQYIYDRIEPLGQ
jgi:hypothetical protein